MMKGQRFSIGSLLLCLLATSAPAQEPMSTSALQNLEQGAAVQEWLAALDEASRSPRELAEFDGRLRASDLSTPEREFLLFRLVGRLREMPVEPGLHAALQRLGAYQGQTRIALDEGGLSRIAFPVDQAAAAALIWQEGRAAGRSALSGEALPSRQDLAWRAGVVAGLAEADDERVSGVCQGLKDSDWLRWCASRLRSLALYQRLIALSGAAAAPALAEAFDVLSPAERVSLLTQAATSDALRSAAFYQMSRLPDASAGLLRALADEKTGTAAAAALARCPDPGIIQALADRLESPDLSLQRRVILALKLRGGPEAMTLLAKYSHDNNRPAGLRKEVASWLGE